MPPVPGQRLGSYDVTGRLGQGGMGEVFRATDSALRREVAIKVLPAAFAGDRERLARFEREAHVLAQLHHPNIASIFGFHEADGVRFLALELVPGETLEERIARGPIPLEEAIAIAAKIADGLEYAHERGIVHRDLKPANLKLTPEGDVKILDFGLAKAVTGDAATGEPASTPTVLPTVTSAGTAMGIILGSAAYMSPEQARGRPVDKRTDIWAFGVVLYEMLTGKRLFGGETVSDTIAEVLKRPLDAEAMQGVPEPLRGLLARCLERDPKARLRDVGEARIALDRIARGVDHDAPAMAAARPVGGGGARPIVAWTVAALAIAAAVAFAVMSPKAAVSPAPLSVFGILVPYERYLPELERPIVDISSDGRTVLFVAEGGERRYVFRRTLDRLDPVAIPGTQGAEEPRLSPDGKTIAFIADGAIRKIPVEGGAAVALADARAARGMAWASDGSIVYSPRYNSGLFRVSATGGTPVEVTKLDPAREERSHRWPQVLPDGKTVIFTVGDRASPGDYDGAKIDAVSLETGERKTILTGARMARYSNAGYLVYQQRETLMAVRFDPVKLEVTGRPFTVLDGVGGETSSGAGAFDVGGAGAIAVVPKVAIQASRVLALVDRTGHERELSVPPARFNSPRFSPDGTTIAVSDGSGAAADDDIYLVTVADSRSRRLTFGQGHGNPLWSRDGKWVAYTRGRSGEVGLAEKPADGSGSERMIQASAKIGFPDAWIPGERLVMTDASDSIDIKIIEADRQKTTPLFASPTSAEYAAAFSPDGRLVAYTSTESGTDEVFVETFPPGGGRWQVTSGGGISPTWSHDGRELYYLAGDRMMAVDVETHGVFRYGVARQLFSGPYIVRTPPARNYDIGPDGRFVMVKSKYLSGAPRELLLVEGWASLDPEKR